jgi:hypothetical protein
MRIHTLLVVVAAHEHLAHSVPVDLPLVGVARDVFLPRAQNVHLSDEKIEERRGDEMR